MVLLESQQMLQRGDKAPDYTLLGIDGRVHRLEESSEAKALLVVFMCNHCPYVLPKISALKELQKKYAAKGLLVVGINANDPEAFPEDDFENMKSFAKKHELNFLYR